MVHVAGVPLPFKKVHAVVTRTPRSKREIALIRKPEVTLSSTRRQLVELL